MEWKRWTERIMRVGVAALVLTAAVWAAETTIENEQLRVRVIPERNVFEVSSKTTGKTFVRNARLAGPFKTVESKRVSHPVWGDGKEIEIGHENGGKTTLRLFAGTPFLHLHSFVGNPGDKPYVSSSEEVTQFEVDLGLPPERLKSFGTGFLHPVSEAPGSFSFSAVVDPETRNGVVAACLTHERGCGVFFTDVVRNRPRLRARIDFGRYQVNPGKTRQTETLLIGYFDDARLGLEAYADAVVRHYNIQLRPQPVVYCTWYHARSSDEEKLLANGEFVKKNLKPFGLDTLQIDDHWQKRLPEGVEYDGDEKDLKDGGPIKVFTAANENFPKGMPYTAKGLTDMGLVAGIWFMPFAGNWKNPYFADRQDLFARWPDGTPVTTRWSGSLLDMSNPKTQTFVRDRVKRIAGWGYGYFKLDGMHTGAVNHNVYVNTGYSESGRWINTRNFVGDKQAGPGGKDVETPSTVLHDPNMTHIEAYRKGLEVVREAAPEVVILGCNVSQNMRSMGAAFGMIDAMRIGPDNGGAGTGRWSSVMVGPRHGSNLYFLNRRVWHNDPDPVYVRPSNPLNAARLMVSWVAISGSMLTTSYQFAELPEERLDLLKRCMPGHRAVARPADLFESNPPRIWLVTGGLGGVRRDTLGLFNWKEKEPDEIRYDMKKIGLDPTATYAAFDYWEDRFVEPIRGELIQTLAPGTCRILAVRPVSDRPQLLSTSRHITQGIIDALDEKWDAGSRTLSGTSLVVAGDPYELRIVLPESGGWKVRKVSASGAKAGAVRSSDKNLRVAIETDKSGEVSWKVEF